VRLELAPRAVRDAERCAAWWRENRPAARTLSEHELRAALDWIRDAPLLGGIYEVVGGREYRRTLMAETPYHVYYRVAGPELVRVLAIWSAVRGRGPRF
jgi:plasmid stabilization system protein ParE